MTRRKKLKKPSELLNLYSEKLNLGLDKKLIFRHDNVPHFPKIKTHPHHKHTRYRVTESQSPGLLKVIDEVETLIIKEKH